MNTRYVPAIITLIASLITCIICIVRQYKIVYSLELLLGTILIFYIIGLISKKIIQRTIEKDGILTEEAVIEDETEETEEVEEKEEEA